jgi:hypothetical protein
MPAKISLLALGALIGLAQAQFSFDEALPTIYKKGDPIQILVGALDSIETHNPISLNKLGSCEAKS